MRTILVTGGAGYLGSVLGETLLDAGYGVTILNNLLYGRQHNISNFCADLNVDFLQEDTRHEYVLKGFIQKTGLLIPLVAIVGAPACDGPQEPRKRSRPQAIEVSSRERSETKNGIEELRGQSACPLEKYRSKRYAR